MATLISSTTVVGDDGKSYQEDTYSDGTVVKYPQPPTLTVPVDSKRSITKFAFRNRFTDAEKVQAYVSADGDQDPLVRATLKVFLDDLMAAVEINLDDSRTKDGLNYLVSLGVLTQTRAAEILA